MLDIEVFFGALLPPPENMNTLAADVTDARVNCCMDMGGTKATAVPTHMARTIFDIIVGPENARKGGTEDEEHRG